MTGSLAHHGDAEVGPGLVDLAVNVGPTPSWLELTGLDLTGYPRPQRALAAVAARHGVDPDRVLLTNGAAEAFVLVARAFRPRRAAVVHPQFTEPEAALLAAGHPVERIVLDGDFRLSEADVPEDADLLVIGNPTNPTGVLHSARLLRSLRRPGRVVVVDEAFADCVPDEPESVAGEDGFLVVRSLTKTFGLAGLRAGYVLGDIGRLRAVQQLWPVSTPALAAIEQCVGTRGRDYADQRARELARQRTYLQDGLRAAGVAIAAESVTSFVLVRLPNADKVRLRLRESGFAVRRGDTFPGLGAEYLRIAVRPEPVTDAFLAALRGVLDA